MSERSEHRRLVFLHGFTQTHHHWHECAHLIAQQLSGPTTLAFVDLPGHGLSGDDQMSVEDAARELGDLAGPGVYVGYSMGARHALMAACIPGSPVEAMVLIGGSAGLDDEVQRADRRTSDGRLADRIEMIGVDAFIDEWLAQPLFEGFDFSDTDRRHRLSNTAAGLATSLRLAGTGTQRSVWTEIAELHPPALVLAGSADTKFVAIGEHMAELLPRAEFATIEGAGHAAHAEQPSTTARAIAAWLLAHESERPTVSSTP